MTKGGAMCRKWENAAGNQTEYGVMVKAKENYCTNIYTDEPVCFPRKNQSAVTPCDIPICSKFLNVQIMIKINIL
jgi:hypothetical protein